MEPYDVCPSVVPLLFGLVGIVVIRTEQWLQMSMCFVIPFIYYIYKHASIMGPPPFLPWFDAWESDLMSTRYDHHLTMHS